MKRALPIVLLALACATPAPKPAPQPAAAPPAVSAESLKDTYGDSTEAAVTVPVEGDEVAFENNWIYDRFGRFRRVKFAVAHQNDRHYDIITVELPDHSQHAVYFDITDLWMKWAAEKKQ